MTAQGDRAAAASRCYRRQPSRRPRADRGLTDGARFPYLLLLVSGGHTQLVGRGVGHYRRLGTTIDDALGEAFDKTAKLLGLPIRAAQRSSAPRSAAIRRAFALPRPLMGRHGLHFSFSGLKTAVRQRAEAARAA